MRFIIRLPVLTPSLKFSSKKFLTLSDALRLFLCDSRAQPWSDRYFLNGEALQLLAFISSCFAEVFVLYSCNLFRPGIIHTRRPVKFYKRHRVYFGGQVIAKKNNCKPRRTVIKTPDKKKIEFLV